MVKLDIWENRERTTRRLWHTVLTESELIEAISLFLLANGRIALDSTYEISIDSITR